LTPCLDSFHHQAEQRTNAFGLDEFIALYRQNPVPLPGYTDKVFSTLRYDVDERNGEGYPSVDEIRDRIEMRKTNCKKSFPRISLDEFPDWRLHMEHRFTGLDPEVSLHPPIMDLSKSDLCLTDPSRSEVNITLDVDSVLAIFHRLDVVNAEINFYVYSNIMHNLKKDVHIFYESVPIHKLRGWCLGYFVKNNMKFDIHLLLPKLSPTIGKINYAAHKVQQFFYDRVFLKAIRDVIPKMDPQHDFPITWEQEKYMCEAVQDNKIASGENYQRQLDQAYPVAAKYLRELWIRMNELLKEMLDSQDENDHVGAKDLEGMFFFVDSKNLKKKLFTSSANMKDLQEVLSHKVR